MVFGIEPGIDIPLHQLGSTVNDCGIGDFDDPALFVIDPVIAVRTVADLTLRNGVVSRQRFRRVHMTLLKMYNLIFPIPMGCALLTAAAGAAIAIGSLERLPGVIIQAGAAPLCGKAGVGTLQSLEQILAWM